MVELDDGPPCRLDPFPRIDGPEADVARPSRGIVRDPEVEEASASVVKVLGTVDDPSGRYLMMEWVEGEDLAHVLRRDGSPGLAEEQVIRR